VSVVGGCQSALEVRESRFSTLADFQRVECGTAKRTGSDALRARRVMLPVPPRQQIILYLWRYRVMVESARARRAYGKRAREDVRWKPGIGGPRFWRRDPTGASLGGVVPLPRLSDARSTRWAQHARWER
jgi:hypothetical protein